MLAIGLVLNTLGIGLFCWAIIALAVYAPVSYTHLRAHETVLDLVCRLLLEKKNNMRNNHSQLAYASTITNHY